ncbi:hypothetical protein ACHQM5_026798 [Ranunculus cassubicifolius]
MDCNKDEAIKAKLFAEKKMESKDFVGARKLALKAQQLYSDLDGISQMMTVIDVHCSAEKKVMDKENDWYGILKLELSADEASIKKQYRKLALLLHPDKNKLAGAEAAFKLIGEAHRVLSDRDSRWKYDSFYKAHKNRLAHPQQRPNTTQRQPAAANGFGRTQFATVNLQREQPNIQPGVEKPTFWTVCPFCTMKYQYYRDILNRALRCQNCLKPFIAYDLNVQGVPTEVPGANWTRPPAPSLSKGANPSNTGVANKAGSSNVNKPPAKKVEKVESVKVAEKKENLKRPKAEAETVNAASKKKRRAESETSESADSESSSDEFEILDDLGDRVPAEQNPGHPEGRNARRSSRQKREVVYNEDSDDDFVSPRKDKSSSKDRKEASTGVGTSEATKPEVSEKPKESAPFEGSTCNGNENGDAQADECEDLEENSFPGKTLPDPELIEVADPEFYEFDNDRKEDCFKNDQMWAVYDNTDGMPRFYARIKKVFSNGSKVRITWLEPNPDDKEEIDWVLEELPVACGKFKHGKSETTEDINMFSHLVPSCKEIRRGSLVIYPAKGETWAIFKNWKMDWNSDPDAHRTYEFDFVEIMSEYGEGSGVIVSYLEKLKGFVGLFRPKKDVALYEIPSNEIYRFSHMVPSYRMKGDERDGVPEGAIELDPASLPNNLVGPNNS